MKTVRYQNPETRQVHLGLVVAGNVYSITRQVPEWTDPVPMWHALRALGLAVEVAAEKLCQGPRIPWTELEHSGLLLPPVASQEVWAAGVTYERSRDARNAETKLQDSVYDRVYAAQRPELFFKATGVRVVATGQSLGLRSDSQWMVPEPELTLVISAAGDILGWTVGNDLSSRDIEGENPLYLPQAKMFAGSCALGPVLLWNTGAENPLEWTMDLVIRRNSQVAFQGTVALTQFRRSFGELVAYLRRDNPVADGTALMTGTGIVPPDDFTLAPGDVIEVSVEAIGTLRNTVGASRN
ncbi:hypothetical protein D2Q93_12420 [Alicyclobacillaceae bacterium I2511]|nr:hypothetical protein D2Q93_12420 [Alicyclobacillaceae bacterium I2511]